MYSKESAPKASTGEKVVEKVVKAEKAEKPIEKALETPSEKPLVKQEESKDVTMEDPDAEDGEIRDDPSAVKKEEMKMETLPKQETAA